MHCNSRKKKRHGTYCESWWARSKKKEAEQRKARSSTGKRRSMQRIRSPSLEAWHMELWTLTASSLLLFLWLSAVTHCCALPSLRWELHAVLCSGTPQPHTLSSTSMWTQRRGSNQNKCFSEALWQQERKREQRTLQKYKMILYIKEKVYKTTFIKAVRSQNASKQVSILVTTPISPK